MLNTSGIGKWAEDTIKIKPGEIFTSLDLQIIRNRNNYKENVVTVIFSDLSDKPLFPVSWKTSYHYIRPGERKYP